MDDIWKKVSPWFHIIALVFTAGVAWAGVSAQDEKIRALQDDNRSMGNVIVELRISQARIEESLLQIKSALNIKRSRHTDGDME